MNKNYEYICNDRLELLSNPLSNGRLIAALSIEILSHRNGEEIAKIEKKYQAVVAENIAVKNEVICWAKECDRIVHRYTNKITDMHQSQATNELGEILKETTQAINEIKAQGVEEQVSRLEGEYGELDDVCVMVFRDLREFAASLRSAHEIKS